MGIELDSVFCKHDKEYERGTFKYLDNSQDYTGEVILREKSVEFAKLVQRKY